MNRSGQVSCVAVFLLSGFLCCLIVPDLGTAAEKGKVSTASQVQKPNPVPSSDPQPPAQQVQPPQPPGQSGMRPPVPLPPPPPGQSPEPGPPPIKSLGHGVYEIGPIRISKNEGKVEFPALVNMCKGLLEYALVGRGGKVHESLLRTDVEPYFLQIAVLLMGLEGTTEPLTRQGDPRIPSGDPVVIRISWQDGDQKKEARLEEWILNKKSSTPMQSTSWIFTGSVVMGGRFMAQVDKSIVAIYHDPSAMFDNPLPGGESDEVWFANEAVSPPPGTRVTVTIQKEEITQNP